MNGTGYSWYKSLQNASRIDRTDSHSQKTVIIKSLPITFYNNLARKKINNFDSVFINSEEDMSPGDATSNGKYAKYLRWE